MHVSGRGVVALGAAAVVAGAAAQAGDAIGVRAVRFYRGDRTLVNGFVEVPVTALSPVRSGPGGFAAFRVEVAVRDAAGTVLRRDAWAREVPWGGSRVGSATAEQVTVALAPGAYHFAVVVTDSASGRRLEAAAAIEAYPARPRMSDLLLASRIRPATGADTVPGPGELRKGALLITTGPEIALRPTAATLFFYGEVYGDSAATVPWRVEVRGTDGRTIVAPPSAESRVEVGGGVITGSLDLAGLPPGEYVLRQVAGAAPDTVVRDAPFRMGGLELERRVTEAEQLAAGSADVFARASEAELEELFAPLIHVAQGPELEPYKGLSADGKRRFLRAFWARRDPTPATAANEAREGFYRRIAEANRRFRESGMASVPGWRTDRGRIYLLHGEPDEVLHRPETGPAPPWEAWKYSRDRPRKYVFMDETRLGHYVLIYSDDRRERSYPNWDSMLGEEAVQEITRF